MKNAPITRRTVLALAGAAFANVAQASAMPLPAPVAPPSAEAFHLAAADCYAVGQQVAAQEGGTLAKASPDTQGGQPVCRIVVLLPGKDGQRPRRTEIVVPAN